MRTQNWQKHPTKYNQIPANNNNPNYKINFKDDNK